MADAQPKKKPPAAAPAPAPAPAPGPKADTTAALPKGDSKKHEQTFNMDGVGFQGNNRSPQLLYFLERANEELERASLEKRSFIPSMTKSIEDESL